MAWVTWVVVALPPRSPVCSAGFAVTRSFVRRFPQVEVQLQLSVNPPPLTEDSFDVCNAQRHAMVMWDEIALQIPPNARVIARRIAPNRRLLCASPVYIYKHGMPKVPNDLLRHNCIGIRQGEEAYGVWRLASGRGRNAAVEVVKTRGNLTTNDGEIAVNWALDGHGILMRAEWDIERHLRTGRLIQVLAQYYTPDADIHAIYPQRHQLAARVRAFVDFVALSFSQQVASGEVTSS
jgi:LysR family transcriptional activator of dmlA